MGCVTGSIYKTRINELYLENRRREKEHEETIEKYREAKKQLDSLVQERQTEKNRFTTLKRRRKDMQIKVLFRLLDGGLIRVVFAVWRGSAVTARDTRARGLELERDLLQARIRVVGGSVVVLLLSLELVAARTNRTATAGGGLGGSRAK